MKKNTVKKHVSNSKGFTLIEMTFVLSIVILLTVAMLPFGYKWVQEKTEENAIDSLISVIYSLQSYSMAHKELTKLRFKSSGTITSYVAEIPGKEVFSTRALPEGMCLAESSSMKDILFQRNGDIAQFGVLTIITETKRIAITFQFQRGRMIVRESERVLVAGSDFNSSCTFSNI